MSVRVKSGQCERLRSKKLMRIGWTATPGHESLLELACCACCTLHWLSSFRAAVSFFLESFLYKLSGGRQKIEWTGGIIWFFGWFLPCFWKFPRGTIKTCILAVFMCVVANILWMWSQRPQYWVQPWLKANNILNSVVFIYYFTFCVTISLSGLLWSKSITWKIPEINSYKFQISLCSE